jgi:hypothetical protein
MKIVLSEQELSEAVCAYVLEQYPDMAGREVLVRFRVTRKPGDSHLQVEGQVTEQS